MLLNFFFFKICDSNLKFLALNARYPGATHDAAIWEMSSVYRYMRRNYENGDKSTWLIGDSGYPLQPWLMTPIPDAPENTAEFRYTQKHVRARNVIERAFGVLKQRFRCLLKHRVMHYKPSVAGKIIYTCAVLHNICIEHNIEDEFDISQQTQHRWPTAGKSLVLLGYCWHKITVQIKR